MSHVLHSKKNTTRLQILAEIAANQPNIRQKEIATKINITPQAISEHIQTLIEEELIQTTGRSQYQITFKGAEWLLNATQQLGEYYQFLTEEAVKSISICSAIADQKTERNQQVSLYMKNGMLHATTKEHSARGIATSDAEKNADIGITSINGIIDLQIAKVTICKIPSIQMGGTRKTDLKLLKKEAEKQPLITSIGTEALVALQKINITPQSTYGATHIASEAAQRGVPSLVACVENELPQLLEHLQSNNIPYELLEATL